MNGPAGRRRAVTAALTATVLVALAGLVLTGLEWSSLATSDAVGNVGAAADLRALARGIYPPLLAEQGLVMALRAQAARSPVPVVLEADQVGRYPQDAESTVYFCTLEALQNVAKHAKASAATVRLSGSGEVLEFSVSDDGAGFAAAAARPGSGLQGMSDRLAAHGGTLAVRSQPGQGTTITGRLPASAGAASSPSRAGPARPRRRTPPGAPGRARRASSWPG